MPHQPKPDARVYDSLIHGIENGIIKVPKFQRDFVWSIEKTAGLLDSILKGYPIGTFILWKTGERLNDIKNLGNIEFAPTPEGDKIEYVLDGQQRLTSLMAAYRGAKITKSGEKRETVYKEIYVNLDASEDEAIISAEPTSAKSITLHSVLNFSPMEVIGLQSDGFSVEQIEKIDEYQKAFQTYNFSIVLLTKDDIDSAIDVFTRINTGGQVLTLFEIMAAKTYDEGQNFDMQAKWDDLVKELEESEYETISPSIVLHLLGLHLSKTKECKRSVVLKLDKQEVVDVWDDVISSLKTAIDFFRAHYKIMASRLLPYDALLVPFAYFFIKNKNDATLSQRQFLEKFFWRMALSYRYTSATESKLAQDVRRIDQIIKENPPEYKDIQVYLESPEALIDTYFSAGNSYCKAVMCLLSAQKPRDFQDGADVNLDNSWLKIASSKNYHHFFPKAFLKKGDVPNENSLMNITLVSDKLNKRKIRARAPSDYLSEFKGDNPDFKNTMSTHFIDANHPSLWEDDYRAFLQMRAEVIFAELKKKLGRE
jgi:hypothetical protein